MLDDADIARVLSITAHPDDVDFTFGRKIAALRAHESQTGHLAEAFQVLDTA